MGASVSRVMVSDESQEPSWRWGLGAAALGEGEQITWPECVSTESQSFWLEGCLICILACFIYLWCCSTAVQHSPGAPVYPSLAVSTLLTVISEGQDPQSAAFPARSSKSKLCGETNLPLTEKIALHPRRRLKQIVGWIVANCFTRSYWPPDELFHRVTKKLA